MAALDTNALVRFLVRDDAEQAHAVKRLLESSEEPFYLSQVVLAETSWVLASACRWAPESIAQAFAMLTSTDKFTMDEVCAEAVSLYQLHHPDGVGFADCLILRASKRSLPLYTFDRRLQKLKNVSAI